MCRVEPAAAPCVVEGDPLLRSPYPRNDLISGASTYSAEEQAASAEEQAPRAEEQSPSAEEQAPSAEEQAQPSGLERSLPYSSAVFCAQSQPSVLEPSDADKTISQFQEDYHNCC